MNRNDLNYARALAEKYNARMASEGKRGRKWIVDLSGGMRLVSTRGTQPEETQEDLPI